jgi:hypothetical protein
MIAAIGADKPIEYNLDMGFVIVPPDQRRVQVKILDYATESDPGPFPIPDNAAHRELAAQPQREPEGPARHRPDARAVPARGARGPPRPGGGPGQRQAARVLRDAADRRRVAGAPGFDLGPPHRRPAPGALDLGRRRRPARLPRRGALRRVRPRDGGARMRFTVRKTRRAYVLPATHWASTSRDPAHPRMGESASGCGRTSTLPGSRLTCRRS